MIGEIIQYKHNDDVIKGLVFCYMPNGGPEMDEPYVKIRVINRGVVNHHDIHLVKLSDPTFETLTLDRSVGAQMERSYAGKTEDPECGR